MQLMDKLESAWDAGVIGNWSPADKFFELSKGAEDCNDDTHTVERFAADLPYYKSILERKHAEKIQAAVECIFRDINSSAGDQKAIREAIGSQHTFLVDKFAWLVLQAIADHKQHGPGVDDFDGRIQSKALRQLIVDCVVRK